jgi:ribonuclease P protein component
MRRPRLTSAENPHTACRISTITKTRDFGRVYKTGRKFICLLCAAYVLKNSNSLSRIGIVVSKKVDSRAVVRNKIKRVLASWARTNMPVLLRHGYDIVVVVKQGAGCKPAQLAKLRSELDRILSRYCP